MNVLRQVVISVATAILPLFFTLPLGPAHVSAAQVHSLISSGAYENLLDLVFSHEQPLVSQLQYSMVLRFMSSSHTETEVVLNAFNGGKRAEATLFRISGASAWNTANDYIQGTGKSDLGGIAKLVHVTKQVFPLSTDQAALWHSEFVKSLEQSSQELQQQLSTLEQTGETTIVLDGTTYDLRYEQGATQLRWEVMDEEVSDSESVGHSALAKWMNEIRRYAIDHTAKP